MQRPESENNLDQQTAASPAADLASIYPVDSSTTNSFRSAIQESQKLSLTQADKTIDALFDNGRPPSVNLPKEGTRAATSNLIAAAEGADQKDGTGGKAREANRPGEAQAKPEEKQGKARDAQSAKDQSERRKEGPDGSVLKFDDKGRVESIKYPKEGNRQINFHYDKGDNLDRVEICDGKGNLKETRTKTGQDQWQVTKADGTDCGVWKGSMKVTKDGNLMQQGSADKEKNQWQVIGPNGESHVEKISKDGKHVTQLAKDKSTIDLEKNDKGELTLATHRDKDGRLTKVEIPGSKTTEFKYDSKGNLEKQNEKDKNGNLTRESFADGKSIEYQYGTDGKQNGRIEKDKDGKTTRTVSSDGMTTDYKYDKSGKLLGTTTADEGGRTVREDFPDGSRVSYNYGQEGELASKVTTDKTGRTMKEEALDGSQTIYKYGDDGKLSSKATKDTTGRTTAIETPDGNKTEFNYDKNGKLSDRVTTNGAGQKIKQEWADGRNATFEYDKNGKPIKMTEFDKDGKKTKDWDPSKDLAQDAKEIMRWGGPNGRSILQMQKMWDHAKQLGGNPHENMAKALNTAVAEAGWKHNKVSVDDAQSKTAPDLRAIGMTRAEAVLMWTMPADQRNGSSGISYYQLGDRTSAPPPAPRPR